MFSFADLVCAAFGAALIGLVLGAVIGVSIAVSYYERKVSNAIHHHQ